jgi:predicted dehydrogenase
LQQVLASGRIGRVLASHLIGSGGSPETGNKIDRRFRYFKDREAKGAKGQVALSIYLGQTVEFVASLLGQPRALSAQLQVTWPYVDIVDGDNVVERNVKKTADDYASLHGILGEDVKYSYVFRSGDAFEQGNGLVWDIIGDKGQIRITGATILFNMGADNYKIQVKDYETGEIETIPLHEKLPLPLMAQNVGMVYKRYAEGTQVPTFEDAVRRYEFLDAMFASDKDNGSMRALT